MLEFTRVIRSKGWMVKEVATRWGVTPQRMSQIAKNPTQKDWDAIGGGLPVKRSEPKNSEDFW